MERVRIALAAIKREPDKASEVLQEGFKAAPVVFGAGVGYFIAQALRGEVIEPEYLEMPTD